MDLLKQFQQYISSNNLFQKQDHLLIAVSGGVDSVVLCELCKQSGYQFSIAHCNFQLRGAESDRDEIFVKTLGEKYRVEVFIKSFDTVKISKENKTGIEETARNLRYSWFSELAATRNPQPATRNKVFVITAHHADDNIETVLMNFFRGTGIKGLHGILPKQEQLIRPLLFAGKADIATFAKQQALDFVTDSSNAQQDYSRNFFRNELIPAIEKVFPEVKQNILKNIRRLGEAEQVYNDSIFAIKKKLLQKKVNEVHIPVLKLAQSTPLQTILFEVIKEYGFTAAQVPEAEKLLTGDSGKYIVSASYRLLKNRNWLIISPLETVDTGNFLIEENTKEVRFSGNTLTLEKPAIAGHGTNENMATLNAAAIKFPLLLRKWKTGDYFYPLGMQKKKKLSRFFIDRKLSLIQKEKTWVIESDRKIIWVIGLRIDNRFRLTGNEKEMLKIIFLPAE